MKSKLFSIVGESPLVQVHNKREAAIERKARELLVGRTVARVNLIGDSLELHLDNGARFTMQCHGGFVEPS